MISQQLIAALARLYQGRPYTKVIPFNHQFTGNGSATSPDFFPLWATKNAYFEAHAIFIKGTISQELVLCDTDPNIPFFFVQSLTTDFNKYLFGNAGYRSNGYTNAQALMADFAGNSGTPYTVKGVMFGFEVTPDEYYR